MKNTVLILFLFTIGINYSQSKKELIDTISKSEMLESDCVGIGCEEGQQYLNFKKLKKLITEKELTELTKNENPFLRMYASIELIDSDKGNVVDLFKYELNKKDTIARIQGCIIQDEPTYSIIYDYYRGKIFFKVYDEDLSVEETQQKQESLILADKNLDSIDKIIINSKDDLNWLLYNRAFEFRKYSGKDLERVAELAFEKNNSYALLYLKFSHSKSYNSKIDSYLKNDFVTANFNSVNGIFYLHSIIEYLLDSENDEYKNIAIKKLKTDDSWKSEKASFENTLMKYNIEL
jgi:hypothetical protein|tara:strand:- start:1564 stop:2439 length:876 start_codon:yes stop_codon:yes gene_type:complete